MQLAKNMGLKPRIETRNQMEWHFMPADDKALERMMARAEKNFKDGKYLSAKEAQHIVSKWK